MELYSARFSRGYYKSIDLFKIDATTGKTEILLTDSSETMVEYQTIEYEVKSYKKINET